MFEKIKNWILAGLAVIGGVFGAIFYVLFQQKKDENKLINEKYENAVKENQNQKAALDAVNSQQNARIEREKKYEEEHKNSDSNLNTFNHIVNGLSDN